MTPTEKWKAVLGGILCGFWGFLCFQAGLFDLEPTWRRIVFMPVLGLPISAYFLFTLERKRRPEGNAFGAAAFLGFLVFGGWPGAVIFAGGLLMLVIESIRFLIRHA